MKQAKRLLKARCIFRSFDSWIPKENIVHGVDTDTTVVNKGTARGKKGLENPPAGAPVPKKRKGKRRRKF